jgi:hypothetical protein
MGYLIIMLRCPLNLLLMFRPLLFYLLLALPARAQLRVSSLAPAAVPPTLKHAGRVVQALRYTDRTGTYTVLATHTKSAGNVPRADLYAYQYPATGVAPTWQVHDFIADCPLDLQARFRPKGVTVTDLDQNGTAEVWLVYRTVCRGDVSPSTQKIIMYEGKRKYVLSGNKLTVFHPKYCPYARPHSRSAATLSVQRATARNGRIPDSLRRRRTKSGHG